ncbi:MAG TPA: DUF4186 family protein [Blastocatellia bacterium]|nr:DUF4186 family protein [Blastocatellia bacterium]
MAADTQKAKPKSLKGRMSCGGSDCDNGLHCFRTSKKKGKESKPAGSCQVCGKDQLVDWKQVQSRDSKDIENTVTALKNEWVRHQYWCVVNMSPKAIIHARKKGLLGMREAAENRIRQSVGKAENFREGFQTPWEGDRAVYYAQHATATCCRRCIENWHGIEFGRDLTQPEISYLAQLVMRYIEEKIELTEQGEKPSEIREKNPELFSSVKKG